MAFSRKKIEERKAWLRGFVPGTYLDHTASDITYTDFVNKVVQAPCALLSVQQTSLQQCAGLSYITVDLLYTSVGVDFVLKGRPGKVYSIHA